jgi:UDP-N-acetylglucosamine 2-epimerase (non-hydrolysing)
LRGLAAQMPVVFPVHPRTASRLEAAGVDASDALRILEPMDYPDFIALEAEARVVVTDSGGVQEETSAVGTPCLTYRTTTERPITCELGTNELVGTDPAALSAAIERVLAEEIPSEAPEIPLWDGAAGPRAAESIEAFLGQRKSV